MTREEVNQMALDAVDYHKCIILELITGYGKTKIAIDVANKICNKLKNRQISAKVLILVAKSIHKATWVEEIKKWGGLNTENVVIECYESLHKYQNDVFDIIIMDEQQHLSDRRKEILRTITINEALIGLSATIKDEMREYFKCRYNAYFIQCDLREAIDNNILPEPEIYLYPLDLDSTKVTYTTKRFKNTLKTTQRGYYNNLNYMTNWYKEKYYSTHNPRIQNLWRFTAIKRFVWCSEQKESVVKEILDKFKNYKTLTFCSSIEQSKRLGKYNINSKNKDSIKNYNMFNSNKIKHITAVNILNENANLNDCRIGIFCNLNASEIITKQRCGRLLRHKKPVIIIPYFNNTRESEVVEDMIKDHNTEHIHIIKNIDEIKI